VPVDFLLADMLVAPLSLIDRKSRYRVGKVTEHLRTNLHVASTVAGCQYNIQPTDNTYIVSIVGST
jgi:RNA 3'-terminal phosphate cyclase (ATP)